MDPATRKRQHFRDFDSCGAHKFGNFGQSRRSWRDRQDQCALFLRFSGPPLGQPGKFTLQRADLFFKIEVEGVNVSGFDSAKRFALLRIAVHAGKDVGQLNPAGIAVLFRLDRGNEVQTQQRQVVQVVLSGRLPAQMRVYETKPAKPSRSSAEPSYVGEFEMGGVSQDHLSNNPVSRNQYADLPSQFTRECA